jgi:hypothetical protein
VPVFDATGAATGLTTGVSDYRVVRGEFVYRSGAGGSTRIFVLAGLNDSSPDLGFGLSFASRAQSPARSLSAPVRSVTWGRMASSSPGS